MPAIIPIPAFADNYIWLLRHDAKAAVADPGDAAPVIEHLEREGIELCAIVNTHHHGDHVGGNHGRDLPDCVAILAGASRVEERILTMCGTSGAICPTARPVGRSFARVRTHSDHDHSGRNLPDRAAILARFVHAISIPTFA